MKQILTLRELCELMNVKPSWLKSMVFRKKIPFIKLGKHIRFEKDEVQKWIEEKKVQEESWT